MSTGGRWRQRAKALVLGCLAAAVLLEVGLQLAALLVSTRDSPLAPGEAAWVVCQGDSNTYGFNLPAPQSYPGQLQALFEAADAPAARVINRGVPGKPSWVVCAELEHDLELLRPRALVVWCGVNDRNLIRPEGTWSSALSKLRSVAMLRRLASNAGDRAVASSQHEDGDTRQQVEEELVELEDGTQQLTFRDRAGGLHRFDLTFQVNAPEDVRRWIEQDLARSAEIARARGVEPFFLCYPDDRFQFADLNQAIAAAAQRARVPLIDPRAEIAAAVEQLGSERVFFADAHLRAVGYAVVARCVWNALAERGLTPSEDRLDPLEPVRAWRPDQLVLAPWIEDGRLRGVSVRAPAGAVVQLVLAEARGSTPVRWNDGLRIVAAERAHATLPLGTDRRLRTALKDVERFRQRIGDSGEARFELALDDETPDARGRALWAAAASSNPGGGIDLVSAALELQNAAK